MPGISNPSSMRSKFKNTLKRQRECPVSEHRLPDQKQCGTRYPSKFTGNAAWDKRFQHGQCGMPSTGFAQKNQVKKRG